MFKWIKRRLLLSAALEHSFDIMTRIAAEKKLVQLGDQYVIEYLTAVLKDSRNGVDKRRTAESILWQIGNEQAIAGLCARLPIVFKDASDYADRERIAKRLDDLGWIPGQDEAGAAYWIAMNQWHKCIEIGQPARELLIALLRNNSRPFGTRPKYVSTLFKIILDSSNPSDNDVQELIGIGATEIRILYDRSRREKVLGWKEVWYMGHAQEGLVSGTEEAVVDYHDEHDPDMAGIQEILSVVPETLRKRIIEKASLEDVLSPNNGLQG